MSRPTLINSGAARAAMVLALAAAVAGCGSGDAVRVAATVSVAMPDSVPLHEPLHVTYTWTPSDDFSAPMEDYQVFVHARDGQGNVLFQDDHYPPEPTSQWQAGQTLTYDRWIYVPDALEVDQIDFVTGLYSADGRALLRGDAGTWTDAVDAHTLEVRLNDMQGVPAFIEGWHGEEGAAAGETWRWSEGVARAAFTNPRKDGTLHLRAHGPFDEVGAQVLVLRAGETEIARIDVTSPANFEERIVVPATAMGDDDWVEVTLEISPALVPKELDPQSSDERVLGLQVFMLYLSSS
ncbi:MAG: hypothetical protein GKS06_15805 [Acidobacteria bacterium]|nr:hypothetical protein [Acidobacteriota bacterium]